MRCSAGAKSRSAGAARCCEYFGEDSAVDCGNCDVCLQPAGRRGTRPSPRRSCCRASFAPASALARATSSTCCSARTATRSRSIGHDTLSTFGIGGDLTDAQWRSVIRQLLVRNYLRADVERFGALVLTQTSRPLLRGDVTLRYAKTSTTPARSRKRRGAQPVAEERHRAVGRIARVPQGTGGRAGRAAVRDLSRRNAGRDDRGAAAHRRPSCSASAASATVQTRQVRRGVPARDPRRATTHAETAAWAIECRRAVDIVSLVTLNERNARVRPQAAARSRELPARRTRTRVPRRPERHRKVDAAERRRAVRCCPTKAPCGATTRCTSPTSNRTYRKISPATIYQTVAGGLPELGQVLVRLSRREPRDRRAATIAALQRLADSAAADRHARRLESVAKGRTSAQPARAAPRVNSSAPARAACVVA